MRNHTLLQKMFMTFKSQQIKTYYTSLANHIKKSPHIREDITREEALKHLGFSLNLDTLFKILRNAHILTPELSKPSFLRLFYGDTRNMMPKYFDFFELRNRVRELKLKFYFKD